MELTIYEWEVIKAKEDMKVFDSQKTFNKFKCNTNYIGLLGEMVLDRFLTNNGVEHTWVPFIKKGTKEPDFIINGHTIDLKTSSTGNMWLQRSTPFDIYISATINKDNTLLSIKGWLPQGLIAKAKQDGQTVTRGSNVSYVISGEHMLPIYELVGLFPFAPQSNKGGFKQ